MFNLAQFLLDNENSPYGLHFLRILGIIDTNEKTLQQAVGWSLVSDIEVHFCWFALRGFLRRGNERFCRKRRKKIG
jgi:hypothetical protein